MLRSTRLTVPSLIFSAVSVLSKSRYVAATLAQPVAKIIFAWIHGEGRWHRRGTGKGTRGVSGRALRIGTDGITPRRLTIRFVSSKMVYPEAILWFCCFAECVEGRLVS